MFRISNAISFYWAVSLIFSQVALSANKFIFIEDGDPIPMEKFIYALYDLKTQKLYLGYSKTDPVSDEAGMFSGGIRNGGHVELLKKKLGIPNANRETLEKNLPPIGQGTAVGGGFILGEDGITHLHRLMSNKGFGRLGEGKGQIDTVNPLGEGKGQIDTVNPRLPQLNLWTGLVPKAYTLDLYRAIAKRTNRPLKVDHDIMHSLRFPYNHHPENGWTFKFRSDILERVRWGTEHVEETANRVNQEIFRIVPSSKEQTIPLSILNYLESGKQMGFLRGYFTKGNIAEKWGEFIVEREKASLSPEAWKNYRYAILKKCFELDTLNLPNFVSALSTFISDSDRENRSSRAYQVAKLTVGHFNQFSPGEKIKLLTAISLLPVGELFLEHSNANGGNTFHLPPTPCLELMIQLGRTQSLGQ